MSAYCARQLFNQLYVPQKRAVTVGRTIRSPNNPLGGPLPGRYIAAMLGPSTIVSAALTGHVRQTVSVRTEQTTLVMSNHHDVCWSGCASKMPYLNTQHTLRQRTNRCDTASGPNAFRTNRTHPESDRRQNSLMHSPPKQRVAQHQQHVLRLPRQL